MQEFKVAPNLALTRLHWLGVTPRVEMRFIVIPCTQRSEANK
jgi:hypothetical protein